MIGGGARPAGTKGGGAPRLEYDEAADNGRDAAGCPMDGIPGGRAPMALVLGTKSNRGARSGATPY